MKHLDWSHLQSFVAVAEHGSLSAAARAQGSSQPTLSRHIALLEQEMGARLFDRSKSGVTLTDKGSRVLADAAEMADAAARLSRVTQSAADALTGTVRITASRIVATFLLPDVLTELHQTFRDLEIELVASDDTNNLLRREADIALRMYRPTQNDVITKHLGDLELGAYASKSYVARRGRPEALSDMLDHDVVGYDQSDLIIDGLADLGLTVTRDFFKFRSDDQVVCWQMVRAGFGIGFNQKAIGDQDPGLVCVSPETSAGILPVWLTAHPELRKTPRIRKVYDHLSEALKPRLKAP